MFYPSRFLKTCFVIVILFLTIHQSAQAENFPKLTFGCAPWDGRTLDITIGAPDLLVTVEIWAKGYEDLQNGIHTIAINNKGLSPGVTDATGRALLKGTRGTSPNTQPTETFLTIHFDELELKDGGKASGYVQMQNDIMKIPFQGVISGTRPCG